MNQFFQRLPACKEQWKFIEKNIGPSKKKSRLIKSDNGKISKDTANIVNCLFRKIANLGGLKCTNIAFKHPKTLHIPEFTLRAVTRKELYSVTHLLRRQQSNNELPNHLIQPCKLAIDKHQQFALIECIKAQNGQTKQKLAFVTPIFRMADKLDIT